MGGVAFLGLAIFATERLVRAMKKHQRNLEACRDGYGGMAYEPTERLLSRLSFAHRAKPAGDPFGPGKTSAIGLGRDYRCVPMGLLPRSKKATLWRWRCDRRVSLLSEVLAAVRVVKMNCWEIAFASRLEDKRHDEVHHLSRKVL